MQRICVRIDEKGKKEGRKASSIIREHYGGVFRNIKERMIEEGYVEEFDKIKNIKKQKITRYRLSFKGSLVILSLLNNEKRIKKIIQSNENVNPFYNLVLYLEQEGISWKLIHKTIVKGIINGVREKWISLESSVDSIMGQSIVTAINHHFHSLDSNELQSLKEKLESIDNKNQSSVFEAIIGVFTKSLITPMLWKIWIRDRDAQLLTLFYMLTVTLYPEEYFKQLQVKKKSKDENQLKDTEEHQLDEAQKRKEMFLLRNAEMVKQH